MWIQPFINCWSQNRPAPTIYYVPRYKQVGFPMPWHWKITSALLPDKPACGDSMHRGFRFHHSDTLRALFRLRICWMPPSPLSTERILPALRQHTLAFLHSNRRLQRDITPTYLWWCLGLRISCPKTSTNCKFCAYHTMPQFSRVGRFWSYPYIPDSHWCWCMS